MMQSRQWYLGLVLALAVQAFGSSAAAAQAFKWWQDERFQQAMNLTPAQITKLDAMFQQALPELRAQKRALDKLEDELSQMILEARVGEPELAAFVVRVEAARAELGKTRTLQLYRMRCVLSADQHKKMKALHDEWQRDRGKRDDHGSPQSK